MVLIFSAFHPSAVLLNRWYCQGARQTVAVFALPLLLAKQRVGTSSRVAPAVEIVRECDLTSRGIVTADGVMKKRRITGRRVEATIGVAKKRKRSISRVGTPGGIA